MRKLIFITLLVLALVPSSVLSQRTSVSRQFPVYDNGGKPDLVVDPQRFVSQMEIVDRLFTEGSCAIEEGVVGGSAEPRPSTPSGLSSHRVTVTIISAAFQTTSC